MAAKCAKNSIPILYPLNQGIFMWSFMTGQEARVRPAWGGGGKTHKYHPTAAGGGGKNLTSLRSNTPTHILLIKASQPSGRRWGEPAPSAAILHNIWTPSSHLRVSQLKSRRSAKRLCVSKKPEGFRRARCQPRPQIYHSCTKSLNLANFNSFCWDQQSLLLFFHESPASLFFFFHISNVHFHLTVAQWFFCHDMSLNSYIKCKT